MDTLIDHIIADIFNQHRSFLPGKQSTVDDVQEHLTLPILVDNLDREEKALILSALPRDATGIYLSPMDKGLSGAKVFASKYIINNRKSKVFVLKLGPLKRIEAEYDAVQDLVCPHIQGVLPPVYRQGFQKGLLAQEFGGLGAHSVLESFRIFVRNAQNGDLVILRLLNERLANWYLDEEGGIKIFQLGELFDRSLRRIPDAFSYPSKWLLLQKWINDATGYSLPNVDSVIKRLKTQTITSVVTTVHGDLHTQNILVDEHGECWPIDFAWCRDKSSPIVDLVMLECSLKFHALPREAYLGSLFSIETSLCSQATPKIQVGDIPYCDEIENILRTIIAVRRFGFDNLKISFPDYQKALLLMTYSLSAFQDLNMPYILSSLQILCNLA